ncbi:glutamate--cysteine ligase [Rhodococcus sp. X156]|uniref:glutamate--cysteine ligase n=1 Tax=Rhodococcus sp. X156 TaxID=2499145 RepID=UPI000FDA6EDC|nr:glutamate--cysteine ligase [Rhodococcus sp. X156]
MGEDVTHRKFTRGDRARFRAKAQDCLDALTTMLADGAFEPGEPQLGMEVELNLVDEHMQPAMANAEVLTAIADPDFQTELGQFNIEINVAPRPFPRDETLSLEQDLRASLNAADAKAREQGSQLVMVGMLPTLRQEHFHSQWLSKNPRYDLLNEQIFAARGEDIELDIEGVAMPGAARPERLRVSTDTILPEAACTSVQLHLQVEPDAFAAHWNAAQCLSGVQVALAANSPFLAETALWHESRVPVFEQATDTRSPELRIQGVRPRVWFGERWITSIFDLFEENARYFPALLPVCSEQDPQAELAAGRVPELHELKMHNGTVYRWNRPVYDTVNGEPHLRIENRVLPAGPSVLDTMADAAFYYGTLRALANDERPLWTQMSFDAATENLHAGARDGLGAKLYWPDAGWMSVSELVLRKLLPLAHEGLIAYGLSQRAIDRYLGVIEGRCVTGRNGAVWQRERVAQLQRQGADRRSALTQMLHDYTEGMHADQAVHTWAL